MEAARKRLGRFSSRLRAVWFVVRLEYICCVSSLAVSHDASAHLLETLQLELRLVLVCGRLLHLYELNCLLMGLRLLRGREALALLLLISI